MFFKFVAYGGSNVFKVPLKVMEVFSKPAFPKFKFWFCEIYDFQLIFTVYFIFFVAIKFILFVAVIVVVQKPLPITRLS